MKEKNSESLGMVVLLMVAMAALLYSCGSTPNTGGAVSSAVAQIVTCPTTTVTDVSITSITSGFQPNSVSIAVNDIVRWTNNDSTTSHTVTSGTTGQFDSGNVPSGHTVCMQFLVAGSYGYFCSIHPSMTGVVKVQ